MPTINKALAILAALAFFFPFISISCNGTKLVEMSGVKVVKCTVTTCSPDDVLSSDLKAMAGRNIPNMDVKNIPGRNGKDSKIDGGNFVVFAAIACLVAVAALFVGARGGELVSGVASVAAIGLLFMFHSEFSNAVNPHLRSPGMGAALVKIELQFAAGFWMSIILSGISAILAFKGTGGLPSPVAAGGRGSIAGFVPTSSPGSGGGQQMSSCPSCGAGNSAANRFCLSCGASLAAAISPEKTICPSCNLAAAPGNKFCLSCGSSLASKPDVAPQAAAAMPQFGEIDPPPAQSVLELVMSPLAAAAAAAPTAQPLAMTAPSIAERPSATSVVNPGVVLATTVPAASPESSIVAIQPLASPAPVAIAGNGVERTLSVSSKPACPACGAEVGPSQKFCLACGTPLGQPPVAEASAQTDESAFAPAPSISQDQQGSFQAPLRDNTAWIAVALLLAVMGVAGWFVWKYFTGPDVTVTTFQKRIHVAPGRRTSLQASVSGSTDTDVDWSIQEGDKGGSIASLGSVTAQGQSHAAATYTAPQTAGTFHVIAASHANPSRTAKIEIVVGGASQPDAPASPGAVTANPGNSQILGTWRWPTDDRKVTISADSILISSDADPQKNLSGTYHFTDASHLQIDFGNGDVRTWQILGIDNNYLRILCQSKTESSPTAMILAKMGG